MVVSVIVMAEGSMRGVAVACRQYLNKQQMQRHGPSRQRSLIGKSAGMSLLGFEVERAYQAGQASPSTILRTKGAKCESSCGRSFTMGNDADPCGTYVLAVEH